MAKPMTEATDQVGRLTDVAGVRVGHWTDEVARTGCTVVLLPPGTTASGDVRGGAPASRELALLDPSRLVDQLDAVLLTGGSAFGLAAADGVMRWLEAQGRGYPTPAGPVPIVASLGVYDLAVGDASVRPGPDEGVAACDAATGDGHEVGRVGVGTGCTTGKWLGAEHVRDGGVVSASMRLDDVVVAAIVAVNASGSVGFDRTSIRSGEALPGGSGDVRPFGNTTVGVVVTDARLDKAGCLLVAQSAHDGLARAVFPAHTRSDGDAFIAAATGQHDANIDRVRIAATIVVERAILGLADR
jgi:L-aminopeptidase/D-esterase-like protein